MLDQVLAVFDVKPDYDLDLMQPGQTLAAFSARLIGGLEKVFRDARPSLAVVQGDTTTTVCAALAAFYARVPVAHVEAGLRTFDMAAPFPEEMNRVVTGRLAALHFAATEWAAENLRRESVPEDRIEVTGNTGIDAVLSICAALEAGRAQRHRMPLDARTETHCGDSAPAREFWRGFASICQAMAELGSAADVQIVWPFIPIRTCARWLSKRCGGKANILLIDPLDYLPFVDLMRRAYLLITDSGGVQEEGPSLGKPMLVLREKTERPEAVEAGTVKLVGTGRAAIVREAVRLLENAVEYERMARLHNPYGDGHASERIVRRIASYLQTDADARTS